MQRIRLAVLAVLLSGVFSRASAQVAEHKGLTLEGARNVIGAAIEYARTKAGTGVIAVVDEGGNQIGRAHV